MLGSLIGELILGLIIIVATVFYIIYFFTKRTKTRWIRSVVKQELRNLKRCPHCGKILYQECIYCPYCGKELS